MSAWAREWLRYLEAMWVAGLSVLFVALIASMGAGIFIGLPLAFLMKLAVPTQAFGSLLTVSAVVWLPLAIGQTVSVFSRVRVGARPLGWRAWKAERLLGGLSAQD